MRISLSIHHLIMALIDNDRRPAFPPITAEWHHGLPLFCLGLNISSRQVWLRLQ